jgi:hypothetical protein
VEQQQGVAVRRARATLVAPMVPPAPAVFSTTKLALPPMALRIASPSWRATRSVGPPAANGTTMEIGLEPGKGLCVGQQGRRGNGRNGEKSFHGN